MALFSDVRSKPHKRSSVWAYIAQRVLLIPEAGVLLGLVLLGWKFSFPPLIGFLAILTVAAFALRLGLLSLAEQQLARGAYAQADRLVRAALRLNPWSADALVLRAQGLSQRGEDEAAEQVLRRAACLYPHDHMLQSALAASVVAQGRLSEGWQLVSTDQEATTDSPLVLQQLAWFALHVEDNPARARTLILRSAPDRLPPPVALPLLTTLAGAHIALGAQVNAREVLKTIEFRLGECAQPQQAELLYHLGRLYQILDDNGAVYYRRCVELDPDGRYAQAAWRSAVNPGT